LKIWQTICEKHATRHALERVGFIASLIAAKNSKLAEIAFTIIKRLFAKIQRLFGAGFALLRPLLPNTAYATKIFTISTKLAL
jgi:hypothetical protein